MRIRACQSCGSRKIKRVCKRWTGEFRGQTYVVPSLEFHECPECGEKVYGRDAMRRIEEHSPAFSAHGSGVKS